MADFSPEIKTLYAKYKSSTGVTNKPVDPPDGSIYFATKRYKPRGGIHLVFWKIWRLLQLYAPSLLKIIEAAGKKTRWADNLFRDFDQKVIDGNAFAKQALANGATLAVIDNRYKHQAPDTFLVEDAMETLYELARYHRGSIDIPIIGITGSVGKTTTVHLVDAILSKKFKTAFHNGSNSAMGNSMNILNVPADAEVVILEMSSIGLGFLTASSQILQPTHGLITHTGMAHLDTFGTLENVQNGKWELFDYILKNGGTTFLNMNHSWLSSQAYRAKSAITFGGQGDNQIVGHMLSADPFIKIRWQLDQSGAFIDIQTKLAGEHNLDNVLGGIAIGHHFGVSTTDIVEAIEAFEPVEGRSQIFKWGSNTIYNEGFQCNAPSTVANLKSFAAFSAERKMLILEQVGLIQPEHPVHQQIIDMVQEMDLDQVLIIGERYLRFKPQNVGVHLLNRAELRSWLLANPIQDTHIMLNVTGFIKIRELLDEIPAR